MLAMRLRLNSRFLIVSIQGLLSALPFAAVTSTLQTRFIMANASLFTIGCLSLINQMYLYKFLFAPLVDTYKPPLLNKVIDKPRGWILFNQLGLILTLLSMAILSAKQTPWLLALMALFTATFSAFQDVSIDAYRILLLPTDEITEGSTWYLAGFRIGLLLIGGASIMLSEFISWSKIYALFAVIITFGMLACYRRHPLAIKNTQQLSLFTLIIHACKDLKKRPSIFILLLFITFYGLGDAFTLAVNNTFLVKKMHFSLTDLALYANLLNLAMLLMSTLVARFLFKHWSLSTCLLLFGLGQLLTLIIYMLLAYYGPHKFVIISAVLLEGFCGGLTATAIIVVTSFMTRQPFTATQYALLAALANIKNVVLGPLAAYIVQHFNWTDLYFLGVIFSIPGLVMIGYLKNYFHTESRYSCNVV